MKQSTWHIILLLAAAGNAAAQRVVQASVQHLESEELGPAVPLIKFGLGTPAQEITGIFDTASSDIIVPEAAPFNPDAAADLQSLDGKSFNATLSRGDHYEGNYSKTTVTLGGAEVSSAQVGLASIVQTRANISDLAVVGVGLVALEATESKYNNLPRRLNESGVTNSQAYSVVLNATPLGNGSVFFGGIDRSKFEGELQQVPIAKDKDGKISEFLVELSSIAFVPAAAPGTARRSTWQELRERMRRGPWRGAGGPRGWLGRRATVNRKRQEFDFGGGGEEFVGGGEEFSGPGGGEQFFDSGPGEQFSSPGGSDQFFSPGPGDQFSSPGGGDQFLGPGNGDQGPSDGRNVDNNFQGRPDDNFQGRPDDNFQSRPDNGNQGRPDNGNQNIPDNGFQNRPGDTPQNRRRINRPPQNRPDDRPQNRPEDSFQNRPEDSFQNRPKDSFQNRPDDTPQNRPGGKQPVPGEQQGGSNSGVDSNSPGREDQSRGGSPADDTRGGDENSIKNPPDNVVENPVDGKAPIDSKDPINSKKPGNNQGVTDGNNPGEDPTSNSPVNNDGGKKKDGGSQEAPQQEAPKPEAAPKQEPGNNQGTPDGNTPSEGPAINGPVNDGGKKQDGGNEGAPKPEAPKPEAPKPEAPKQEPGNNQGTPDSNTPSEGPASNGPVNDGGKKQDGGNEGAPKPEAPKPEAPKPEAPKSAAPKPAPTPAAPKPAPKPAAPKPAAPKPAAPKPAAPKPAAPKPAAPKPAAPKPAPKPEAPKKEAPKQEAPKKEAPKPEAPKKENGSGQPAKPSGAIDLKLDPRSAVTLMSTAGGAMALPAAVLSGMARALGTSFSATDGLGPVDCGRLGGGAALLLRFSNDTVEARVPLANLRVSAALADPALAARGLCEVAVRPVPDGGAEVNVATLPFFAAVYTVFDLGNGRLWFAQAKGDPGVPGGAQLEEFP
ncbi:candidapepsin-4 precursor [Cordyceps fumosorosea ARSEF 2679]|uniref:Candidapepsin-4 n=1 Tax=Cordyceps fumosorosea (strain ARSEF 2679) TaxID=1081104 RepID=A0A168DFX5_CORFA|nr:candidapepsin-4 precursor [Cordyceps fumosorosea ARSEF 2679]OAA72567.1 candidapepsin-4 precursor [Cordyceps fumosorosea ARSEF 2679]